MISLVKTRASISPLKGTTRASEPSFFVSSKVLKLKMVLTKGVSRGGFGVYLVGDQPVIYERSSLESFGSRAE